MKQKNLKTKEPSLIHKNLWYPKCGKSECTGRNASQRKLSIGEDTPQVSVGALVLKKVSLSKIRQIRKKHNVDILNRMQEGDPLKSYDSTSSWFPPRPVIKKDSKIISKLYALSEKPQNSEAETKHIKEILSQSETKQKTSSTEEFSTESENL